jgi:hypothetical protein
MSGAANIQQAASTLMCIVRYPTSAKDDCHISHFRGGLLHAWRTNSSLAPQATALLAGGLDPQPIQEQFLPPSGKMRNMLKGGRRGGGGGK